MIVQKGINNIFCYVIQLSWLLHVETNMKLNHVENYLYLYLYISVEKDENLLGKIKKRGDWKIIYIYTDEKLLGKIKKGEIGKLFIFIHFSGKWWKFIG